MTEYKEIPGYYPGKMGPPPGAPPEGSAVKKQMAKAAREPLSPTGIIGPEQDKSPFKPPVPITNRPSGQTPKNPL